MGWILCLVYVIGYAMSGNEILLLAAALFAISGAISEVASAIRKKKEEFDIFE